jgi:hypothetical protein
LYRGNVAAPALRRFVALARRTFAASVRVTIGYPDPT